MSSFFIISLKIVALLPECIQASAVIPKWLLRLKLNKKIPQSTFVVYSMPFGFTNCRPVLQDNDNGDNMTTSCNFTKSIWIKFNVFYSFGLLFDSNLLILIKSTTTKSLYS